MTEEISHGESLARLLNAGDRIILVGVIIMFLSLVFFVVFVRTVVA